MIRKRSQLSAGQAREHEEIYEAIARQDSDAARATLHLTNSRERLRHAHEEAEAQRG